MEEKYLKVLAKTLLFKDIKLEDLNSMLECLKPRINTYKKNECIAIAGEEFSGIGTVLSGNVVITKENAAGNRVIIAILKAGELFGEIAAFSDNALWPATVYTQEASTVLFLPSSKIIEDCENRCLSHRQLVLNMLKIVSNKALALNKKIEYMSIKSMRGKISTYLYEQYKKTCNKTIMLSIKRNEMAELLNVSRPSLSREMSRMRDEGIIDFYRSSIRIVNLEALKQSIE